jgi:hypothetical protein
MEENNSMLCSKNKAEKSVLMSLFLDHQAKIIIKQNQIFLIGTNKL